MAFKMVGRSITEGIYEGQNKGIYLGSKTKIVKPSQNIPSNHYLGFKVGDDYVDFNAYYDSDNVLNANFMLPKLAKIGYVQICQIKIDGQPIPLTTNQKFLPQREAVTLINHHNKDIDYWWFDISDMDQTNVESIFYAWEIEEGTARLVEPDADDEEALFIFPQTYGCFVRRTTPKQKNESLCASAFSKKQLITPVVAKQNNFNTTIDFVSQEMPFNNDNLLFQFNNFNLINILSFFSAIWVGLANYKQRTLSIIDVPKFQFFYDLNSKPFLVMRGNYTSTTEHIYPILVSTQLDKTTANIYLLEIPQKFTEDKIQMILNSWLQTKANFIGELVIDINIYNQILDLGAKTLEACQVNELPFSKHFSFQPLVYYKAIDKGALLIRDCLDKDGLESLYCGLRDPENLDTMINFYDFDQNTYADLMEENGLNNDIDPFNLDYSQEVGASGVFEVKEYTFEDLSKLCREKGINIDLKPTEEHFMEYRIIDGIVAVEIENKDEPTEKYRLSIVDAFLWDFSRTYTNQAWGDVVFNADANITTRMDVHQFFYAFVENYYKGFPENKRPIIRDHFFRF